MDSVYDVIQITEGLGDCIIAGACVQKLAKIRSKPIGFNTNDLLAPILRTNPYMYLTKEPGFSLKWASQISKSIFAYHTMQRFSIQLGINIDPTEVLDLYDQNSNKIRNSPTHKNICINISSKEKGRRFIPTEAVRLIETISLDRGYSITYIGDGWHNQGITDIEQGLRTLQTASLFIGPISFWYHLAACIRIPCMLFTSYMPEHKFSHFETTVAINPTTNICRLTCEEDELAKRNMMNCWNECQMVYKYDKFELERKLISLL